MHNAHRALASSVSAAGSGYWDGPWSVSTTLQTLDDRILHDPSEDIIAQQVALSQVASRN